MSDKLLLCLLEDLQEPGSKGISVACGSRQYDIFIVRTGGEVHAWMNSCPHTGGPLDWVPDQFLSLDKEHIQCSTHHALFRWQDGVCVKGPCHGDALTSVPVVVEQERVLLLRDVFCSDQNPDNG